ncbi:MAG: 4a-hydroxytetrahydrobiopterin dehydratase [Deltaproteobacteria bacterium]|nr:4a-hydroxytetrahydrobiopterin dehydratase [Deltaproteobacteria bacterium]
MDLSSRKCAPCTGGIAKLTALQIASLAVEIPAWTIADERQLRRQFKFRDFRGSMAFVNRLAELAESEGHHPDFAVSYATVNVTVWTHDVGGLSENDFILAAKIDRIDQLGDRA